MYKRILVATDGSELAERGVESAIELAKNCKSSLYIVTVTSIMPSYGIVIGVEWSSTPDVFDEFRKEMEEGAKKILQAAMLKAEKAGVKVKGIHAENQLAAAGIVDAANEHDVDLVVIASHGRRGVNRLLLGSQAMEVLTMSKCSVMVIKSEKA